MFQRDDFQKWIQRIKELLKKISLEFGEETNEQFEGYVKPRLAMARVKYGDADALNELIEANLEQLYSDRDSVSDHDADVSGYDRNNVKEKCLQRLKELLTILMERKDFKRAVELVEQLDDDLLFADEAPASLISYAAEAYCQEVIRLVAWNTDEAENFLLKAKALVIRDDAKVMADDLAWKTNCQPEDEELAVIREQIEKFLHNRRLIDTLSPISLNGKQTDPLATYIQASVRLGKTEELEKIKEVNGDERFCCLLILSKAEMHDFKGALQDIGRLLSISALEVSQECEADHLRTMLFEETSIIANAALTVLGRKPQEPRTLGELCPIISSVIEALEEGGSRDEA